MGEFRPGNKTIYVVLDEESDVLGPRRYFLGLGQVFRKNVPEKEYVLIIFSYFFLGYVFPKQLGLDSSWGFWDLEIRIPRRKLRI